jgi:hypothetical protein
MKSLQIIGFQMHRGEAIYVFAYCGIVFGVGSADGQERGNDCVRKYLPDRFFQNAEARRIWV